MLSKIYDIYLYSAEGQWKDDSDKVRDWLTENGVAFSDLCYRDESQHELVHSAVNTWFPKDKDITTFPFIIYTEEYTDAPPDYHPRKFLEGVEAIMSSNLLELSRL